MVRGMDLRQFVVLACFLVCSAASAQAPELVWPREVKAADGTVITVYQPQVESWADNNLSGRAAVAVKRPNEKEPHYGVIELSARTEIDKSARRLAAKAARAAKG